MNTTIWCTTLMRHFINFMSDFFPNIEIYANANKMPELCAFYFSYTWAVCAFVLIWYIYRLPRINKDAREYFGIGEFKGKGIFKEKFIPVANGGINGFALWVFSILFFGFAVYINFSGHLVDSTIGRWMFDRFGILLVAVFQNLAVVMVFFAMIYKIIDTINLNRLKKYL
ncbi:hypothetical protein [Campylobacter geochelonis]|uniref:Uncharacterized protein n=2 Tax=Campylobacter geochelonis TaxID=1780362 RepID=A0A128EJG4_9BACT|nr:hypothetical protein [Campylobacter geochelonis]QKF71626.1 putative membrane protein [Campylobacter geochelonis]CZE48691.1 Uncharacterised protein [Campylobacter geochelonis]